MLNTIFPWQTKQWQMLHERFVQDAIPHALLFTGPLGVGKRLFAEAFAKKLLCTQFVKNHYACNECHACQLIHANTHPDFAIVMPEEKNAPIKVDQIRAITEVLGKTAQLSRYKIVIIDPAEVMNIAASNALLKTLEEPTANTVILLLSSRTTSLPATIRTRCQAVRFETPAWEDAKLWLETKLAHDTTEKANLLLAIAEGAPLRALRFAEGGSLPKRVQLLNELIGVSEGKKDPVQLATEWNRIAFEQVIEWLLSWTIDIIRLQFGCPVNVVRNSDLAESFRKINNKHIIHDWFFYLDQLYQLERQLRTKVNLNTLLWLERLFCAWSAKE